MSVVGPYIVFALVTFLLIYLSFLLRKKRYCFKCKAKLPKYRIPKNFKQALGGGRLCPSCGSELDRYGNDVAESKLSKRYLKQVLSGIGKFILSFTLAVVVYIVVIPILFSVLWGKDIPPVDDADLMLPIVTLADEENMFIEMDEITNDMIYQPEDYNVFSSYLESDSWSQEYANDFFEKNREALALWSKAAEKNAFQLPFMANPDNAEFNKVYGINKWRSIARVSLAYAVWLSHNGKHQEAVTEAMKSLKIGNAMINSQINLIGYLVGLSTKLAGLAALDKIVTERTVANINREALLSELQLYNNKNKSHSIFKGDYLTGKKIYSSLPHLSEAEIELMDTPFGILVAETVTKDFYYKPNVTISYMAALHRKHISVFNEPCAEHSELVAPFNISSSPWGLVNLYFTENAIGKVMLSLSYSSMDSVLKRACELQTKQQETYDKINRL